MNANGWKIQSALFIVIVFIIAGCSNDRPVETVVTEDILASKRDTLAGPNIQINPSIDGSFKLDTTDIKANIHHTGIHIVQPVVSQKEYHWVYHQLDSIKKYWINAFSEEIEEDTVYMENEVPIGASMGMEPLSLYKTDSVVSLILETRQSRAFGNSYFEFSTINFDKRTGKPIRFAGYFETDTHTDSISLWRIINRSVYDKDTVIGLNYWGRYGEILFGFDKDNVYFCFEKYHSFTWGIIPIKKKYINYLIRKEYR